MCIVLRSTADGERNVLVYGQNGYVKELDESMLDRAMTATADEIADSVDIYIAQPPTTQTAYAEKAPVQSFPADRSLTESSQSSIR